MEPIEALARLARTLPPGPPADATLPVPPDSIRVVGPRNRIGDKSRRDGAQPVFDDEAETVDLRFSFDNGVAPLCHLAETMSGGVDLLDYGGDGWLDVY